MSKEPPRKPVQQQQRPAQRPAPAQQQRPAQTQSRPAGAVVKHEPQAQQVQKYKLPDYLRPKGGVIMGGEEVSSRDIVQPRITICQSNSPQRKQSSDKYIDGLQEADYFNTLGFRYGPTLLVVPVFFFTSNIRFMDYEEGGGILCQAQDGKNGFGDPGGECMRCSIGPILGWSDDGKGKRRPPECTEFKNYACIVVPRDRMPSTEDVAVFSMKTTGIAQSKQWTSKLLTAKMHYWSRIWELSTVEKTNEKDQSWFSPVVKLYDGERVPASIADKSIPPYFVNEEMHRIGHESYQAVMDLRKQGKLKVDVSDLAEEQVREPGADEHIDGEVVDAETFDPEQIEENERRRGR